MAICIILVILWVLYTVAFAALLGYISNLPPTPLFEINPIDICTMLALAGWIAFTVFAAAYIFGG